MRTALSPRGPVREVGLEFFSGNGKNIVHNNINEVSSEQKGIFFHQPFIALAEIWYLQSKPIAGTFETASCLIQSVPVKSGDEEKQRRGQPTPCHSEG